MIGMEDGRYSTNQIDFLIHGQYISNINTIANNFNNYFTNVGSSLSSSIKSENDPLVYFLTNQMECPKDPYWGPFSSFYILMTFLNHLIYCFQYYLQMTQVCSLRELHIAVS